jgi:HAMP domain-containing protein
MDYEKEIRILVSENEFLQLQLEDLTNFAKKKEDELELLADEMETAASLRSKIEGNLIEIEHLSYMHQQVVQEKLGVDMLNEELEIELLQQIKGRQKEQEALKEMNSVKVNMEIVNEELNEAAAFYKTVQSLKKQLAEAKSIEEIRELENIDLKNEIQELRELIEMMKLRRTN